jgi:hypothetical protein
MSRAKSLILSESALYSVAVASVSTQEDRHHRAAAAAGRSLPVPRRRYSSFNLDATSDDNDPIVDVARAFLAASYPDLLTTLDGHYDQNSARDRLIKIGRSVNASLREFMCIISCSFRCYASNNILIASVCFIST